MHALVNLYHMFMCHVFYFTWWTKTSLPPSSGVTNPKPFFELNHLQIPLRTPSGNSSLSGFVFSTSLDDSLPFPLLLGFVYVSAESLRCLILGLDFSSSAE